jgi:hypothetical protein
VTADVEAPAGVSVTESMSALSVYSIAVLLLSSSKLATMSPLLSQQYVLILPRGSIAIVLPVAPAIVHGTVGPP